LTALGFAATLGLASCADDPMSPIPTAGGPDLQVVPVQPAGEEIYLSDELEDDDPALQPEFNGGLLFQVQLDDATLRANLTLIADLRGACAANLPTGVDCDVAFDKPHIGATPDGARVYVINRFVPNRPQDQGIYSGTPLGY